IGNFDGGLTESGEVLTKVLVVSLADIEQSCSGYLDVLTPGELVDKLPMEICISCY
ncbi:hypothetical protein A2U01_0075283, partial [Trifolium medium]|nr:hypothetical protein [Trifolium medium]